MSDEKPEEVALGPMCERISEFAYSPDSLTLERWDSLFSSPFICAKSEDQLKRLSRVRASAVSLAAIFLRLCPPSVSLDRALCALQDAQVGAITAIQAFE